MSYSISTAGPPLFVFCPKDRKRFLTFTPPIRWAGLNRITPQNGTRFTAETAEGAEVKKLKKDFLCELCELGGKEGEKI